MNSAFDTRPRQEPALTAGPLEQLHPAQDLVEYAKTYAREKPDVFALWCFGIGFVLGWKLKPW
ncbi:MAG: hypothetical protein KDA75_10020 [Planctomycetaceae bacterium]|nr:hypothetical protein [Planctomycetaceae bacterium]